MPGSAEPFNQILWAQSLRRGALSCFSGEGRRAWQGPSVPSRVKAKLGGRGVGTRWETLGPEGGSEEVMLGTETLDLSHPLPPLSLPRWPPRKWHLEQPGLWGAPGWGWGGKVKGRSQREEMSRCGEAAPGKRVWGYRGRFFLAGPKEKLE